MLFRKEGPSLLPSSLGAGPSSHQQLLYSALPHSSPLTPLGSCVLKTPLGLPLRALPLLIRDDLIEKGQGSSSPSWTPPSDMEIPCGVAEWLLTLVISGPRELTPDTALSIPAVRAPLRTKMLVTPLLKRPRMKNPQVQPRLTRLCRIWPC